MSDFSQLASVMEPEALARLATVYSHVADVDLWVGGLVETPLAGSLVGPTFHCLLEEQVKHHSRSHCSLLYSSPGPSWQTASSTPSKTRPPA